MNLENLEQRQPTSRELFTGLAPIQIIAVNPNTKKLKEILGTDDVKDPVYEGEENTRIDFWYKNHPSLESELSGKFSIWISDNTRESQTGKKQYIDAYSRVVWAESLGQVEGLTSSWSTKPDKTTLREAKEGEERIYSLLKTYANINPQNQMFKLDDWKALVKGNGSELEEFFNFFNKDMMGVKVLFGIKDGKYQDVFTNRFLGLYSKITDRVRQDLTGEYGYRQFYNDSLEFKKFDPTSIPSDGDIESSDDMFTDGGSQLGTTKIESVENPFLDF